MTFEEDVVSWRKLSDMFLCFEIQVENDFEEGNITKRQRAILKKKIKKDWDHNMVINNPFIKNNATLKEVAKGFFKIDDLS